MRDVTFEARFKEMLYIVGPSGSGKTTLLSDHLGDPSARYGRRSASRTRTSGRLKENALATFRLNKIGFVFQDFHLFPNLTTVENVAIPLAAQAARLGRRRSRRRRSTSTSSASRHGRSSIRRA